MSLTRTQLATQIAAKITDPYNRQNTALLVRECFSLLALHCFNTAEDELTIQQVTGLATALMGKADLINGKVPASQLPAFSAFWGAMAKAADNSQTVDQAIATAVANLVAASPAALDTLNELAAALGNDANFSATITAALATKIPNTEKGVANGVATLDATGKVPASQLPAAENVDLTAYKKKATSAALTSAGTWALTLDEDKVLYAGTLTGAVTVTVTGIGAGVVQVLTFKANGTAAVTLPATAVSEGGAFSNINGTLNKLWLKGDVNELGTAVLYYKWSQ